jgi:hypothetical protein
MLKHVNCEKIWWAEAVSTAGYIKNRVTTSGLPNNIHAARNLVWTETRYFASSHIWIEVLVLIGMSAAVRQRQRA